MNSNAPTLYDRLGGVYAIATVVDDFIDRVMSNPILNANPAADEAHHRVSPAGFKYLVTEMVCWASGGHSSTAGVLCANPTSNSKSQKPSGPLSARDFDDTMAKFGVPDARRNELFAIVQSTKGDIVIG